MLMQRNDSAPQKDLTIKQRNSSLRSLICFCICFEKHCGNGWFYPYFHSKEFELITRRSYPLITELNLSCPIQVPLHNNFPNLCGLSIFPTVSTDIDCNVFWSLLELEELTLRSLDLTVSNFHEHQCVRNLTSLDMSLCSFSNSRECWLQFLGILPVGLLTLAGYNNDSDGISVDAFVDALCRFQDLETLSSVFMVDFDRNSFILVSVGKVTCSRDFFECPINEFKFQETETSLTPVTRFD
jgi:hypothetical protein